MTSNQRHALYVGLITLGLSIALCIPVLATHDFDPIIFAHIGTRFSEQDPNGTVGYDGQFVYFIARDGAEAVPYIDGPSLRYQRILYPLTARALALGQAQLIPWTLLIVNLIAHSIAAGLIALLLAQGGASPYAALIYSLWIGSLFALRFDLNELLCFALAVAAIFPYQQKRYRLTILLLILATMTKELGAIFAAGLALHAALVRGQWRWAILIFGGPVLAFLSWWGFMRLWFGTLPTVYPSAKLHLIPLEGMFTAKTTVELIMLAIFLGMPTVILLLLALYQIMKTRRLSLSSALLLPAAGFVLTMPDVSWQDAVAAYRVALPIIITGLLFVGEHYPQRLKWLGIVWLPPLVILVLLPELWLGVA